MQPISSIQISKLFHNRTILDHLSILFGSGISRAFAFATNIVISRCLGKAAFGQFSLFYAAFTLAWLIPLAFDITFIKYAKSVEISERKLDFMRSTVQIKILYILTTVGICYPLIALLEGLLVVENQAARLILSGILSGSLISFTNTLASSYQEKEKFFVYGLMQGACSLLVFLSVALTIMTNEQISLDAIIRMYSTFSIALGLLGLALLVRMTGNPFILNKAVLIEIISFGKWVLFMTIAVNIFSRIDLFILSKYVSYEEIGLYSSASQLVMLIYFVTGSMGGVFLPKAVNAIKSFNALKDYVQDCFAPISLLISMLIALFIGSPLWLRIIFGYEYLQAASVLRILLLGCFFSVLYGPFSYLFYALDDARVRFLLEFSKFAIAIILLFIAVPALGKTGAALAISMALFINAILSSIVLRRKLGFLLSPAR